MAKKPHPAALPVICTDDTVLPWGEHKGKTLGDIPSNYLLWLLEQKWIADWPSLHTYLKQNKHVLEHEQRETHQAKFHGSDEDWTAGSYDDYLRERGP